MSGSLRMARPPWRSVVFVCTKCAKRQDRCSFRGDLKRALKQHGSKNMRVVGCACLDVCPARAITLAIASDLGAARPLLRIVERKHDVVELALELIEISEVNEDSRLSPR